MLKQYQTKLDKLKFTYFDLSGYGHEGKIEGLEYDEIIDLILELANELRDADLEFVLTALGHELLKREKQ